jgi:hypothetical protein
MAVHIENASMHYHNIRNLFPQHDPSAPRQQRKGGFQIRLLFLEVNKSLLGLLGLASLGTSCLSPMLSGMADCACCLVRRMLPSLYPPLYSGRATPNMHKVFKLRKRLLDVLKYRVSRQKTCLYIPYGTSSPF